MLGIFALSREFAALDINSRAIILTNNYIILRKIL